MDAFKVGLALAGAGLVLSMVMAAVEQRRRDLPPLPADAIEFPESRAEVERAIERMPEEPMECQAIPLDGSRDNLVARLTCNGIKIVAWCEIEPDDRARLIEMGAPADRSCP